MVPECSGSGDSSNVNASLGRGEAGGAGVVVRADLAQGQVGLGCEQDDEQTRAQVELTIDQAQTDADGDERHRDGGEHLEDERRQEGDAQRGHGGRAVLVGRCARTRVGLGLRRARRHRSVGMPATTSRK